MMHLYWCEITGCLRIPDFGREFHAHIARKKHPDTLRASISAWRLLERALREMSFQSLPEVRFTETGKPYFSSLPLHFSLSHSGGMATVIIGDAPCGVDIEIMRPAVKEKLYTRCMHPEELSSGCDFFEIWTKKECIAKLDGSGMPARPAILNTLDAGYSGRFFCRKITDSAGSEYTLSALCTDAALLTAEKRTIIEG